MDVWTKLLNLDRYERTARLNPAILAVAPVVATLVIWVPAAYAAVGSAVGLVVVAGLVYLLMQYGRSRGRALQSRAIRRGEPLASTVALRHRDTRLSTATKKRYHAALRAQGLKIPTAAEERRDAVAADDHYRSAADWLRERSRDEKKFGLLQAENRNYGFRRNLLGLKSLGIALAAAALAANVALALLFGSADPARQTAALVLAGMLALAVLAWSFVVTSSFVEDASWAYTERLLATCEGLSAPVTKGK